MSCDLLQLAIPGVASLQPYQPGKPVEELERELGVKDIIKLASNENPLGTSKKALAVLKNPGDLSRYPDGNGFCLKALLAEFHGVHPDQITLGNGSNEILELIARAILTPEHEVIFSEHAFAVYPLVTQAVGARAVVIPAINYGHDLDGFRQALTERTRLIFIANPNNPTGTWLTAVDLRSFINSVPDEIVIVVDAAYFDYVLEDDYPDCVKWIADHPNLLVTRTFSKAHGLAGMRIGYGIAHRDLADLMNRVRQPFNVNSLAMAMAAVALDDREHIADTINMNRLGMQQLTDAFTRMGLAFIPSAGNFICVDMQRPGQVIFNKLLREGVIVRPVDNYGMPNHLRITIGQEFENDKFLTALKKVIGDW
jgi:histidinol-phosphate aminotransferase